MLNQLKHATKSWLAAIIIGLLVVSLAIWGVSDIFTGGARDAVAIVGKDKIRVDIVAADFQRTLNAINDASDDGAEIDRETAVEYGVDRQVLDQLVLRSAFSQRMKALGLTVSDEAIAAQLAETEAFIDPFTGRFDASSYVDRLSMIQVSPQRYEADVRLELLNRQISALFTYGLRPPDALVDARLRFESEERAISVVIIPPNATGEVAEPTQEEIEAFYTENEPRYATPSRRAFSFVTIAMDDFVADAPVDEELIRETYEAELPTLSTPERRDLIELAAPDEATAVTAAARLRAGETPADVAAALGLPEPVAYDDATESDLLTETIAAAAFGAPEGEVSDPVDGQISWFVYRVDAITPGEQPSFEEAREQLRLDLARDAAGDLLFDALDAFEAARDRGASLEIAAAEARIPVFSYDALDQSALDASGMPATQIFEHPEILAAAFQQPAEGVDSELLDLGEDGYFVIRLDRIVPAAVRPLEEVEASVRAQLMAQKRSEAVQALAETARSALESGATPSAAAAETAPSARGEVSQLKRNEATATVTRQLLAAVFAADAGDVVAGPAPDGGVAVARVDAVEQTEPAPDALSTTRGVLEAEIEGDLDAIFNRALAEAYTVRIDQRLLAQAVGVELDQ